jgi:hypothetical protein
MIVASDNHEHFPFSTMHFHSCRGWALSTLISPLRYLDLHFHNQTTGLSRCIWTPSGTRRTTWTANHLFSFTFANITGPQSFHMVALGPHSDDGSKLNTNSIWQFLYNNNLSYISPLNKYMSRYNLSSQQLIQIYAQINQKVYSICMKLMNMRHNNINFNKKYKKS